MSKLSSTKRVSIDMDAINASIYARAQERLSAVDVENRPVKVKTTPTIGYLVGDMFDLDVRGDNGSSVFLRVENPESIRSEVDSARRNLENQSVRRKLSKFLSELATSEIEGHDELVNEVSRDVRSLLYGPNWVYNPETESLDELGLVFLVNLWNELVVRINNLELVSTVSDSEKFVKYGPSNRSDYNSDTYAFISQKFGILFDGSIGSIYQVKHSEKVRYGNGSTEGANLLNNVIRHFARSASPNFLNNLYSSSHYTNFADANGAVQSILLSTYESLFWLVRKSIKTRLAQISEVGGIDVVLNLTDIVDLSQSEYTTGTDDAEEVEVAFEAVGDIYLADMFSMPPSFPSLVRVDSSGEEII